MDREEESVFFEEECSTNEEEFSEDDSDIISGGSNPCETESTSESEDEIRPFPARRLRRIQSSSSIEQLRSPDDDADTWTSENRDPPQFEFIRKGFIRKSWVHNSRRCKIARRFLSSVFDRVFVE